MTYTLAMDFQLALYSSASYFGEENYPPFPYHLQLAAVGHQILGTLEHAMHIRLHDLLSSFPEARLSLDVGHERGGVTFSHPFDHQGLCADLGAII